MPFNSLDFVFENRIVNEIIRYESPKWNLSNRMLYADDSFAIDFRAIDVNSVELAVLIE